MDRKHSSLRDILGDLTIGSGERKNIVPAENSNRHPKLDESSVDEDDYDDDIRSHSNLLAQLLKDTQRKVNEETVALKKRLVEEKQVALMEAERDYLSKYDRFQSEINSLRLEVRQLQQSNAKQAQQYSELANRAASLSAGAHYVHRSEYSVKKLFDAWRRETMKTRDTERIDRIGSAFSRKYLLEKSFQTMCLNVQRKKNSRLQADAKFKFDSVTNDVSDAVNIV